MILENLEFKIPQWTFSLQQFPTIGRFGTSNSLLIIPSITLSAHSTFDPLFCASSMLAGTLGLFNSLAAKPSQLVIVGSSLTFSLTRVTGNGAKKKKLQRTNSKQWGIRQFNRFPKDSTKKKYYLTFLSWDQLSSLDCWRLFPRELCITITSIATKTPISYILPYLVPRAHHHWSHDLPQQGQEQLLHWNQGGGKAEGVDFLGRASQAVWKLRSNGGVPGQSDDVHSRRDVGCCRKSTTFLGTFWRKDHKICYSHPGRAHLPQILSICAEKILPQWLWSHRIQSASLAIGLIRQ